MIYGGQREEEKGSLTETTVLRDARFRWALRRKSALYFGAFFMNLAVFANSLVKTNVLVDGARECKQFVPLETRVNLLHQVLLPNHMVEKTSCNVCVCFVKFLKQHGDEMIQSCKKQSPHSLSNKQSKMNGFSGVEDGETFVTARPVRAPKVYSVMDAIAQMASVHVELRE